MSSYNSHYPDSVPYNGTPSRDNEKFVLSVETWFPAIWSVFHGEIRPKSLKTEFQPKVLPLYSNKNGPKSPQRMCSIFNITDSLS